MKKRKFMGFLAMLSCATLLTGCDLPGPLQTAVDWASENIVSPIKDLIPGGNKDEQVDPEPEPTPAPIEEKFSVSFSAGAGSGSMASVSDVKGEYVLPQSSFTAPEGYEFAGWKVNGSGESLLPGAKINVSSDVSLVAQWSVIPGISLKELPAYGLVDEELDLDEYVELVGVSDFTVELSDDSKSFASLDGHKISFDAEGEVKFTVSAGGKSASGSIESIRESRLALMDYFEGVGNQYSVVVEHEYQTAGKETEEDDSDDEYDWFVDDVIFHDTNYILSLGSWDSDDEGNAIPGGFLRFSEESENAYTFSVLETVPESEEEEPEEYVELGSKVSSLYLDAYNPEFGVDFAKAKYELDTEAGADLYVIEGDEAKWFAEESLFIPNGTPYTGYPVTKVEFNIYDEAEEGEEPSLAVDAYVYINYGGDYLLEIATLYTDEESVGYELLQEYCVPENEPQGVDYWNYFSQYVGLGDFFLSPTSFVGANGLISLEYGWYDDEGGAIDCPDYWKDTDFEYLPVGEKYMLMSGSSIWDVSPIVDEESGSITGFSPLSGKMTVTSEGDDPVTTVYKIFPIESSPYYYAEEADEGVWENGDEVFAGLANRDNYAPGVIGEPEDIYHEEPGETEEDEPTQVYDGTLFTFDQGKVNGFVDALVAGDQDGLYNLGLLLYYYQDELYDYFYAELTINPNYGTVELIVSLPLGEDMNWQIKFESSYNPSVTQLASSYEAYMIQNVIE